MQETLGIRNQFVRRAKAGREPLKVVLVYDGLADLIRAYEMWTKLAARFEREIQIAASAWNFSMLSDARLRRKAALRSADADMILLSASGRCDLPDHIRNWIRSWIPWKKGRKDALVAVLDAECPLSAKAAQLRDFLRRKAEQTGMDFFCNADHGQPAIEAAGAA